MKKSTKVANAMQNNLKTIKRGKNAKILIVLSFVLIAFFCVNSFKSSNFSPSLSVSAAEPSRALEYYNLEDLQINNVYEPNYEGVLKWNSFLVTGQGNLTVDEKIVMDINDSGVHAILNNYYNSISGPYGEAINFTASTTLTFDGALVSNYLLAVLDFTDNTNNNINYICQFININLNATIYFKDIRLNGEPFPTNSEDPNIDRYSFGGVQLFYVTRANYTRKTTFQPFVYGFQENTGYNSYTSRDGFLMFAGLAMYDYIGTRNTLYRFNTLIGQISGILYGSITEVPAQQFTSWYNENTTYKVSFTTPTTVGDDYYIEFDSGNQAYFVNGGGDVYYIPNTQVPQTSTLVMSDTLIFEPDETIEIVEYIGGDAINLLKTNATNYEIVSNFLTDFHAMVLVDTYTPAPTPEPEPEPEPEPQPEPDNEYDSDKALKFASDNWLALLGQLVVLGPIGLIADVIEVTMAGYGHAPFGDDKGTLGEQITGAITGIGNAIGQSLSDFLANLLSSIPTVFKGIIDGIFNAETFEKIIGFILIIFALSTGGFLIWIKNKDKI